MVLVNQFIHLLLMLNKRIAFPEDLWNELLDYQGVEPSESEEEFAESFANMHEDAVGLHFADNLALHARLVARCGLRPFGRGFLFRDEKRVRLWLRAK